MNNITTLEKELIQKGLNDIQEGNLLSHEEVVAKFKERFSKRNKS